MSNPESDYGLFQRGLRDLVSGGRATKFASVGFVGTAVDFVVLFVLVEFWTVQIEGAKIVGGEAAILVMFVVNEYWTFSEHGRNGYRPLLRRLVTSNLVRASGILVATVILSVLVRTFNVPYLLANAIGIACGFFVNFSAECHYTWRVHR